MNLMDTVDKADADTDNITDIDAMAPKQTAAYQGRKNQKGQARIRYFQPG